MHAKRVDDEPGHLPDVSQGTDAGDHRAAKQVKPDLLVFMHCDGRVGDLVEELIDIGVDILNPVQPECNDLESLASGFRGEFPSGAASARKASCPSGRRRKWLRKSEGSRNTGQ